MDANQHAAIVTLAKLVRDVIHKSSIDHNAEIYITGDTYGTQTGTKGEVRQDGNREQALAQ